MKRIRSYAVLVAAIIAIGVLVYRDPMVQARIASGSGNVQDGYAQALCDDNADYLAANSGGALAMPLERWQAIVAQAPWECTGVRYVGVVNGPNGPEYFYALTVDGTELWYGLTVNDGKVVDIE